ncbi:MAG: TlpA disulfide reductase family protein [Agriterribacter sp.]
MYISTKGFFWLMAAVVMLNACHQQQPAMQINITVQHNPEKQVVSLVGKDYGENPIVLDTVTLNAGDSNCHFETLISSKTIYSIRFQKEHRYILFSNDVTPVNITVDWNNFPGYTVSSPASSSLKNMLVSYDKLLTEKDKLLKDSVQFNTDSLRNVQAGLVQQQTKKGLEYLSQYIDTAKSPAVALYALGILQQQQNDSVTMKPLTRKLATRFPSDQSILKLNQDYAAWLKQKADEPAAGKMLPAFSLPDTSGQPISTQSFHGKYLLIDFWASWCELCRKENPNVVNAYNTYKEKNFAILGVSLDSSKAAWLDAIHKDKLSWQQVSDLKYWKSSVVSLFNIESLPFNVLVDPEGKIIATNLTGPALHQKLATVLP